MFNQTREGKVCKNTFLSEMIYLKLVSGPLSYLQLKKNAKNACDWKNCNRESATEATLVHVQKTRRVDELQPVFDVCLSSLLQYLLFSCNQSDLLKHFAGSASDHVQPVNDPCH